ncbi:MAG: hypothetical protein EOO05_09970, partial [Chitinophagaceae bacterium]
MAIDEIGGMTDFYLTQTNMIMKKLIVLLLVVLTGFVAMAQTGGGAAFYYFGNRKIQLQESNDRIYLRMPAGQKEEDTRTLLRNNLQLGEKSVSFAGDERFVVIQLSAENKLNRKTDVISFLEKRTKALLVRPALRAPDGKEVTVDEGFYVKLKPGVAIARLRDLVVSMNCEIDKTYKYDNNTFLLKATSVNGFDGLKMANRFYESGLFEYAEPDFRGYDLLHEVPPNDPMYNLQWEHVNDGSAAQFSGTAGLDLDVDEAWAVTMGSPSIRIAVLDEGVQRTHPDLINNITAAGFGLVAGNATTGNILSTTRSHGTACAGIIAAEANNGIGVAGIAPLCKIIPVNITTNTTGTFGTYTQISQAIDWAWNEGAADVLSNSWGGGVASSLLQDAIRRATTLGRGGKGAIVLASSGNNDAGLASPALFPEVIAVGATSMCGQRKSPASCDGENFWGGNYGTGLDVSAPGVKIATTRVTGTGTTFADYNPTFNGTSSACPAAAGVTALILSVNSNLSEAQVREILERSATKAGPYSYAREENQPNGSWSSELGYGMVNAKNAVLAASAQSACIVTPRANGPLQVCSGSSVSLSVVSPLSGATYQWRMNGTVVGTGTGFTASQTGNYDVILNSQSGCRDTSYQLAVLVSAAQGALVADAGRDSAICANSPVILGGGPAGSGGTAILQQMRGFAVENYNNELLRFNPLQPLEQYRVIKSDFNPTFSGSNFHSGGASTPYGLYLINRETAMFSRLDTATGQLFNIGSGGWGSVLPNGMTYDPVSARIYAVGHNGGSNILYTVNRLTGIATSIGTITGVTGAGTLVSLSCDNSGQLYGLATATGAAASAITYKINKTTGVATVLGQAGFLANYAQSGDVDPVTDILYHYGITMPQGSGATSTFSGRSLWTIDKTTGVATLVGAIARPYNALDGITFAGPEYRYQWSPSTNLSNPKDANPVFSSSVPGTYVYTLTVTDLCGNTKTDQVTITVNGPPAIPVITPAQPVLSHRNGFRDTLSVSPDATVTYQWLRDNLNQGTPSTILPLSSGFSPSSEFTVRVTSNLTGCSSTSLPVQFVYSEGVLMNTNVSLTPCDTSFYDAGGPQGITGNNFTRTFIPATAGSKMKVTFYEMFLGQFASLFVYDGPDSNSPRIEALSSTSNGTTKMEYIASNPDGVLTIRYSIGSSQSAGWLGGLTCEQTLQYRTVATGDWNTLSSWQSKGVGAPESAWAAAFRVPTKGDDVISIRHQVNVPQHLRIDQLVIVNGGRLSVLPGASLNTYKVQPGPEIEVLAGGTLAVGSSVQLFGSESKIEVKGDLVNAGAINVSEVMMNGAVAQTLSNPGTLSDIDRLVINNAAGITIQGFHEIGQLEFVNGLVNTSAGNMLVIDGTTGAGETRYINGPTRFVADGYMSDQLIPIGRSGSYRPILLSSNGSDGEGSGILQAEVVHGKATTRTLPGTLVNTSPVRYYKVNVIDNGSNIRDFQITLPYGNDDGVTNPAILRIAKDNGAGAWIDLGGSATDPAPGTIKSDIFNTFSDFVLANIDLSVLPVTLVDFRGKLVGSQVGLDWEVTDEVRLAGYGVERSSDGIVFTEIGFVPAINLSLYTLTDKPPVNQRLLYYRLRMVDIDGQVKYSKVITLQPSLTTGPGLISLAPNPFAGRLSLRYRAASAEKVSIELIDVSG